MQEDINQQIREMEEIYAAAGSGNPNNNASNSMQEVPDEKSQVISPNTRKQQLDKTGASSPSVNGQIDIEITYTESKLKNGSQIPLIIELDKTVDP